MNKRRIVFEVTVDNVPGEPVPATAIVIMTAVYNGLLAAKLATDVRLVLLEDKGIFEGVVPRAEVQE